MHARLAACVLLCVLIPGAQAGPQGDPAGARLDGAVGVRNVTATSAELVWRVVDDCGPSYLSYGPEGGTRAWANQTATADGQHSALLSGLRPGTRYSFTLRVPAWCGIGHGGVADGSFATEGRTAAALSLLVPCLALAAATRRRFTR